MGMFVLVGILAFTAWFTAWYRHWENSKYHGEAYITGKAVYLNRQFQTWSGLGEKLEAVEITKKKGRAILEITYSVWTRNGRTPATIRIPVPSGKEEEAESIAAGLKFKVEGGTAAPG